MTEFEKALVERVARICPECDPPGSGQECRGGPCGHCRGTGASPSVLDKRAREVLAEELPAAQARQVLRATGHFTVDGNAALRAIERALSGLDEAIEALEPFAAQARYWPDKISDIHMVIAGTPQTVTVGHLRRARTTLDKLRSAS